MKKYLIVLLCLFVSAPLQAQDRVTLLLDWFINPDHGPIIIAQEKGYFADAGLEVEVIAPADPADPPKMVAAGKADLAVSYQPQLHLQVAEGMPLVPGWNLGGDTAKLSAGAKRRQDQIHCRFKRKKGWIFRGWC